MEFTASTSEVADFTRRGVVVIVKCVHEHVGEWNVATNRLVTLYAAACLAMISSFRARSTGRLSP